MSTGIVRDNPFCAIGIVRFVLSRLSLFTCDDCDGRGMGRVVFYVDTFGRYQCEILIDLVACGIVGVYGIISVFGQRVDGAMLH